MAAGRDQPSAKQAERPVGAVTDSTEFCAYTVRKNIRKLLR